MYEMLTVLLSALLGVLIAYPVALWKTRFEARRGVYESVHQSRARLYPAAWQLGGRLPRRPITHSYHYTDFISLAIELRDWYYAEGGMYLSGGARRAYSRFQDQLESIYHDKDPNAAATAKDYETARAARSDFQTWLTRDLLSRSAPPATHTKQ